MIEKSLIVLRDCGPWFPTIERTPSHQLAVYQLSSLWLSFASFVGGFGGGWSWRIHTQVLQQDFAFSVDVDLDHVSRVIVEGTRIEPQDVCGSVEDATISLWLTSVDDWTY